MPSITRLINCIPEGYHIFNFIIHLLCTGLIWATAGAIFKITGQSPSGDRLRQEAPFIIAVLFLVHPCQTQAVTYISQRFESMAIILSRKNLFLSSRADILIYVPSDLLVYLLRRICHPWLVDQGGGCDHPCDGLAAEMILFKANRKRICILLAVVTFLFFVLLMKMVHVDLYAVFIPRRSLHNPMTVI